jgi:YihY family inner membrane protein
MSSLFSRREQISQARSQMVRTPVAGELEAAAQAVPIEAVRPVVRLSGWLPAAKALAKYMTRTEVHTYAFSVAANVILSLFPFVVMMLTLCTRVFHSTAMVAVVGDLMRSLLPTGGEFIIAHAHPQKGTQMFSIVMLLISSTGVFLPLEVALNEVWGVKKNRSYLHNQAVSIGLAVAVGALAMASVAMSAAQRSVVAWLFMGHTQNIVFTFIADGVLKGCAIVASILLFFLIYWILPNRKIPAKAVIPTSIVIGLVWELAKYIYVLALPALDFKTVYGPFQTSVGLMMWSFISGLLLLGGAHFSATHYALEVAVESAQNQ